jgi:hypothetical protein
MPGLGNAAPMLGARGQDVPLDDCDVLEGLAQDPGGQQAGHARTQHDRALTTNVWHAEAPLNPEQPDKRLGSVTVLLRIGA